MENDYKNNLCSLPYLVREMNYSRNRIEEHTKRLNELSYMFLDNKKIRILKFTAIGNYVRQGFDVDDLNQEADMILLELVYNYLLGKGESEIMAYATMVFVNRLKCSLGKLRQNLKSLDEVEAMEDVLDRVSEEQTLIQDVKKFVESLEGTIKEVGILLFQGYTLSDIEKKLKIGPGSGWFYKERLFVRIREKFPEEDRSWL